MTYEELAAFIESTMSMSHVYQPLLIRTLLDSGDAATIRQIAITFVASDEAILREAEKTIRKMPVPVLKKRGVIDYDSPTGLVTLKVKKLTFAQRARLRALCEGKLGEYVERRGMGIWDYRLVDDSAIPYNLRYQVLAESDRRCALCGATEKERPLDVDHIVPRSRGGSNEKSNLQVLCARCNRAKGNRDTRDFRVPEVASDPECPFCGLGRNRVIAGSELSVAIEDAYPVTKGHVLVIPRRHTPNVMSMTQAERNDADDLLRVISNEIRTDDPSVAGFNIGSNSDEVAGQTVFHAHIHLIPRRQGDVKKPAGGIRAVLPGKQAPS